MASPSDMVKRKPARGPHVVGGARVRTPASGRPSSAPVKKTTPPAVPPKFPRYRPCAPGAPVVGYTGINGAGKSLLAISDCLKEMSEGRKVVSTTPITSPWGDSEPLASLRQLLDLRDCTVFIDEVSVVFSSRGTGSLPDAVVTFLQSMRHQGVTLKWAAPSWSRADIILREVTQVSVNVLPLGRRRVKDSFWPRPIFVGAAALDVSSVGVDETPEKVVWGSRRVYVPSRLPGWGRYDSEAEVSRIGWERQGGVCIDCGGVLPRVNCSPERHVEMKITAPSLAAPARRPRTASPSSSRVGRA